jgi:hypothetical protein
MKPMELISKDAWFDEHWAAKVTPEFAAWWISYYGTAAENSDDEHEYWKRCGFALAGWLARNDQSR